WIKGRSPANRCCTGPPDIVLDTFTRCRASTMRAGPPRRFRSRSSSQRSPVDGSSICLNTWPSGSSAPSDVGAGPRKVSGTAAALLPVFWAEEPTTGTATSHTHPAIVLNTRFLSILARLILPAPLPKPTPSCARGSVRHVIDLRIHIVGSLDHFGVRLVGPLCQHHLHKLRHDVDI